MATFSVLLICCEFAVVEKLLAYWHTFLQVCLTEVLYCSIVCRPVVAVLLSIPSGTDFHVVSVVSYYTVIFFLTNFPMTNLLTKLCVLNFSNDHRSRNSDVT
jgi:hypothetical protein